MRVVMRRRLLGEMPEVPFVLLADDEGPSFCRVLMPANRRGLSSSSELSGP